YYVDKLRPAANDLFLSQQTDDTNLTTTVVQDNENNEEHLEWTVRDITDERIRRRQIEYLVY
ncbi:hypothetical protein COCSADRAFT_347589, partial [Bipolaris sorokiniana ND90Pr]